MKRYFLVALMLVLLPPLLHGQDKHLIDSLTAKLKYLQSEKVKLRNNVATINDSNEADILYEISKTYWSNNLKEASMYADKCLRLSNLIGYKKGTGKAYNSMGVINEKKGNYTSALEWHKKSLKIRLEIGDKKGIAGSYNNIAIIHKFEGNYPEALKIFFAALRINEETGNKKWKSYNLINIGIIYHDQKNYPEALKNYLASLKISNEIGDKKGIASSSANIGTLYNDLGNYHEALKYCISALTIKEQIGDKNGIANSYTQIGSIYDALGSYPQALKNFLLSLKLMEELGDNGGIAISKVHIGSIYARQKKYREATEFLNNGLALSKEVRNPEWIKESYGGLTILDSAQGNFSQALQHYKLYITYRDSLVNTENTKKSTALQMQYEFDKKEAQTKAIQDKKVALLSSQKEIERLNASKRLGINFGLGGGLLGFMFVSFGFYTQNKKTKKINADLTAAYKKLEETQQQLIASEKMAAFGIMASRVAHEIQNPLNFVNNFSEMNEELIDDFLKSETEEEKQEAANALKANSKKINHHGKRAEAIVTELQKHVGDGTAHEFFEENKN